MASNQADEPGVEICAEVVIRVWPYGCHDGARPATHVLYESILTGILQQNAGFAATTSIAGSEKVFVALPKPILNSFVMKDHGGIQVIFVKQSKLHIREP